MVDYADSPRGRALREAPGEPEETLLRARGGPPTPPPEEERSLVPSIHRYVLATGNYVKVVDLRRLRKLALISDVNNSTNNIRIAAREVPSDNVDEFDELLAGDSRLFEATRPGELLSMSVWARSTAGTPTLIVWTWK